MGAYALLKVEKDGRVYVDGGAMDIGFFFRNVSERTIRNYLDPRKWRLAWCPDGVALGARGTLTDDGQFIPEPK